MKFKIQIQFLNIVLIGLSGTSCVFNLNGIAGKGDIISENRTVQKFNSIKVLSSADVDVTKGESLQITVSDYENIIQFIDLEVVNNCLEIKTKPFTSVINSKAKVSITLPYSLYNASISGSGNIKIHSAFNDLEKLSISGSGNFISSQNCQFNRLKVQLTGSGSVNLTGTVQILKAWIAGSGTLQLNQLKAQNGECSISGSGDMFVFVEKNLKASITGSGNIFYSGNPLLNVSATGSGHVKHN